MTQALLTSQLDLPMSMSDGALAPTKIEALAACQTTLREIPRKLPIFDSGSLFGPVLFPLHAITALCDANTKLDILPALINNGHQTGLPQRGPRPDPARVQQLCHSGLVHHHHRNPILLPALGIQRDTHHLQRGHRMSAPSRTPTASWLILTPGRRHALHLPLWHGGAGDQVVPRIHAAAHAGVVVLMAHISHFYLPRLQRWSVSWRVLRVQPVQPQAHCPGI